jgi:hypothetical protein
MDGIKVNVLYGSMNLMVSVAFALARPPGGLAHMNPVGRLVTGAAESVLLHEGLQQVNGMAVARLPVCVDASSDLRKDMAG